MFYNHVGGSGSRRRNLEGAGDRPCIDERGEALGYRTRLGRDGARRHEWWRSARVQQGRRSDFSDARRG